jgi:hypothetical protein
MLFLTKIGVVWPLIINQRLVHLTHICFLAIDHILGFLVETILGKKSVGFSLRYCCKWLFILFSTKIRVVWPLVISQRLVHITPHMVACHRSHSWISGGDHLLVKNPKVLAFGII